MVLGHLFSRFSVQIAKIGLILSEMIQVQHAILQCHQLHEQKLQERQQYQLSQVRESCQNRGKLEKCGIVVFT